MAESGYAEEIQKKLTKHQTNRDTFLKSFKEKNSKVEKYRRDSKLIVNEDELKSLWEDYTRQKEEMIEMDNALLGWKDINRSQTKDLKEDIKKFKILENQKEVKEFVSAISEVNSIKSSNERMTELMDETDQDIAMGNQFVADYESGAKEYKDDGKVFPYEGMLGEAEKCGNKVEKNQNLLEHKVSSLRSKSKDSSTDVAVRYWDNKKDYIESAKKLKSSTEKHKSLVEEIKKYQAGNRELDSKMSIIKKIYDEGKEAENSFNAEKAEGEKTESDKTKDKRILTKRKINQYKIIKETTKKLEEKRHEATILTQKILKGDISVSTKKKEAWNNLKRDSFSFRMRSNNEVEDRYKELQKNTDDLEKPENKDNAVQMRKGLANAFISKVDTYLGNPKKIHMEYMAEKGVGIINDIEDIYDQYNIVANKTATGSGKESDDEIAGVLDKYKKYLAERNPQKEIYKSVRPYIGPKPSRKMLVRLIRRAKLIENSKDGQLYGSEYGGRAASILAGTEKLEELPGVLASKELQRAGMESEGARDITTDTADFVGSTALGGTKEIFGIIKDMKKAKTGIEPEGLLDMDLSESKGRYSFALNIMETAAAGFKVFKEVLSAFKEWKGGTDSREVTKRILSMAESANDLFDKVIGFFNFDVPILSTVKSAISIVLKIADLIRSSKSRVGISKRKAAIRDKVKGGKDSKAYNIDSDEIKKSAKESGYDTRGLDVINFWKRSKVSTAARMHAVERREEKAYSWLYGSAYVRSAEDSDEKLNRGMEIMAGGAADRDKITGSMHTRRHQLRQLHNGNIGEMTESEKQEFDMLGRIETTHEYDILQEANVRMKNKSKDDINTIISEGWSIASSFMKMTASPAAVAAVIVDICEKALGFVHDTTSKVSNIVREKTGNMYSETNKAQRRSKMAANMYDRMVVASGILDDSGSVDIENHEGWEIAEAVEHMDTLYFDLAKGLDAYLSHIIECKSKDDMIEQMSKAFSVEGN